MATDEDESFFLLLPPEAQLNGTTTTIRRRRVGRIMNGEDYQSLEDITNTATDTKCHMRASDQVRWLDSNQSSRKNSNNNNCKKTKMPNHHHHHHHNNHHLHYKRPQNRIINFLCMIFLITVTAIILLNSAKQTNSYQLTNNLIANNLPPKFIASSSSSSSATTNSEIVVRVKEGPGSIGKLIYTLKGEDPDDDPLTFGVLGSMASDLLRIENVPGNQANVYLRKELDRETTESYQMVITLTDGKLGRGNWITKSMLIIVEDINDNYPVFGPHKAAINLREDTKVPLVIETVEASDQDEGRFGQVIYKLEELDDNQQQQQQQQQRSHNSPMFAIETIDGRGIISLIRPLDYEQKALYQLRVTAIDRAVEQERLSTSTNILISVEDCPDNPPMFTFVPSITRVPENLPIGSPILRVAAIDGDRGINNPIEYRIIGSSGQDNPFIIDPDTGQISVARELDRESPLNQQQQQQQQRGSNSNQLGGSQPGSYVIQVKASEVVGSSGSSKAAATDSADDAPPSVTTELTIILTDVNDELPNFDRSHYFAEILENSAPESLVSFTNGPPAAAAAASTDIGSSSLSSSSSSMTGVAKVIDRDQGTNGTFTLHLEGGQAHLFDVWPKEATNEASFMIKISSSATPAQLAVLDYERNRVFQFTVVAREKYSPLGTIRSNSAQMSVYLKDFNDNYPQFDQELYRIEIPENAIKGMHICAVKATDLDSGIYGTQGIRYTELRGEKANKFKLDPSSGVITLKTNDHGFDRETMAQHHLIVEARDGNGMGNRNTSQLLIVLTDVNDQRPKFLLDQYEAFIYENELDFQSPLQVQAVDGDAANSGNSRITYSIVGGDPQQNFTIDPLTGRIRVRSSLIVSAPRSLSNTDHQLGDATATATDTSNTVIPDETTATIIGQQVGQSQAVAMGTAQVAAGLDFERIAQKHDDTRQFNLTIKASDSGLPEPLSGLTNVIVLVYDKNDHAPVFSQAVYTRSIREDAREGSQVVKVLAQDGDHSPINSRITYRISSGASDKFVIDSETGAISVANGANLDIDRAVGGQKRTNYLLNVVAFDGSFGPNQKQSSALVNITIIDVNNKAPEFVTLGQIGSPRYLSSSSAAAVTTTISPTFGSPSGNQQQQQQLMVVYVNEDAPYGLIVTRVVATDLDSSADLRYSINYARSEARNEDMILVDPGLVKDLFSIEPIDGTIKVSKQLDRELFDQVKLRLQVEDIAAQTQDQVAYTYLLIKITDVNDNRPTFKKPVYKAVVNENSISGTSVITLTADDKDLNKTLKYSLDGSPEMMRLVRINPRSGEITVNDKIDRELYSMINVTVRAEDYGHPHPLTGTAQLLITVRDENDNNPVFLNITAFNDHHRPTTTSTDIYDSSSFYRNHNMNNNESTSSSYGGPRHRSLGGGHHHRSLAAVSGAGANQPTPSSDAELNQGLVFLSPNSMAKVREDAPIGHQVAYVRADDADMGNNGRVTYLLDATSSGGKFRIDRDTGIISVAGALDRETIQQYSLIIEACDNYDLGYSTGESRRAFTQVNILITDINDNAPKISTNLLQQQQTSSNIIINSNSNTDSSAGNSNSNSNLQPSAIGDQMTMIATNQPTYEDVINSGSGPFEMPLPDCLFISEFQAINEPILTITALDADDPNTPNGQIDLAIVSGNMQPQNNLFALRPIISSTSQRRPSISTPADNQSPTHSSSESTASSSSSPTNDELDGEMGFGFTSSNTNSGGGGGGSQTAPVTTTTVINTSDEAMAMDSSELQPESGLSNHRRRRLDDTGEFPPAPVHQDDDAAAAAAAAAAAKVMKLSRRRRKRSEPTTLNLAEFNGNFYPSGNHQPSSTIRSHQSFNAPRARLQSSSSSTLRQRTPQVSGGGGGDFNSATTETTVPVIGTMSPPNAPRRLISGSKGQAESGEQQIHLVVTQSLKERVGNYSILVRATDFGQPHPLSSARLINICVQDVNNHAPVFVRPPLNHTIRVLENATIGSYVTQVEATDSDHGQNGELQYSLKPTNIQNGNNDWQSFKIDRLTGIISTSKQFNRQVKRYYTLRVQAQDFGKPTTLSNDIDINIMIVNSGQYQPEFDQQQQQHLQFTENVSPGIEWFTLLPTNNLDDDPALINLPLETASGQSAAAAAAAATTTPNGNNNNNKWLTSPCYFIIDSDDQEQAFHLDRYTHRLSNKKVLDREKKSNYTLLIQATNQCNKAPSAPIYAPPPARQSPATATTTTALDNNHHLSLAPLTTLSPIDETGGVGSTNNPPIDDRNHFEYRSGSLSLPDRSKRSVGGLSLSLNGTNNTSSPTSPTIQVAKAAKLISSTSGQQQQDVSATEMIGFSQMAVDSLLAADKSLLKVVIKVKDVNDNAPKFTQKVYTGGITTEADFGTTFMIVQAIDADADANSQVVYSIVKPIKARNQQQSSFLSSSMSQTPKLTPISSSGSTTPSISGSSSSSPFGTSSIRHKRSPPSSSSLTAPSSSSSSPSSSSPKQQEDLIHHHHQQQQQSGDSATSSMANFIADIPLAEGDDLFVINSQTGEISLNFDPQRHMKGYFEFEIMANDTDGLFDQAKVFIYLLRQDQRVKFVLRLTPQELRQRLNKFRSVFGNITGAIVNIDSYKYYENHDGTVDKKKTSLYLHFVNAEDNTIIDVDKVLTLIDNNIEYLDELYKEFHVLSSEAAHLPLSSSALVDDPVTDQIRTGLLGVSSFLALILVLVIVLCINQRTRYERQLKAATVSAFGSSPLGHLAGGDSDGYASQTNLPNTNLHSQDPNPIWMNGFVSEQTDWLVGGGQTKSPTKQQQQQQQHRNSNGNGNNNRLSADQEAAQQAIEADYLSSEPENSDDLNSLNGGRGGGSNIHHTVSHLHYNVAATATPRDSLTSSHGRVSGSGSGSGSSSTTNERQFLCTTNGRSQTPQKVTISTATATATTNKQPPELIGVLKNGINNNNNKRSHHTTMQQQDCGNNNNNNNSSSTFGPFKEVTIYTEQPNNHQFSGDRTTNAAAAAELKQQQQSNRQQKQQASQVNKIASQFNAKHLQAAAASQQQQQQQTNHDHHNHYHHHNKVPQSFVSEANTNQHQATRHLPPALLNRQQQQQRVLVHSNGTDVSKGIIQATTAAAATTVKQQLPNSQVTLTKVNNSHHGICIRGAQVLDPNSITTNYQINGDDSTEQFESNLSKLSILNLETTEL